MIPIRNEREFTIRDKLSVIEDRGRRPGRLPGGHIDDRAAIKQAILLCRDHVSKFNAAAYGYVTKSNLPRAIARCDACGVPGPCRLFVHHSLSQGL